MGRIRGEKTVVVALALAGAAIGLALGWSTHPAGTPVPDPGGPLPPTAESAVVPVHVSGWVASPGVVWIEEGSLASEAVAAAGGALQGARLDLINLAQTVHEGDQLQVPGPESVGPSGDAGAGLIDINNADSTELQRLPGVGPVLAERIISHRDTIGRFSAVEDLLDVPGIGEATVASMRDLIRPP